MQHIYIDDEGHWNKLTTGWILEVNDNKIEEQRTPISARTHSREAKDKVENGTCIDRQAHNQALF